MFYIKLEKDESLVVTVKESIFRGENLNQKIIYLIPTMIDDISVADSRVHLNYIRADGIPNVVQLEALDVQYNEEYCQYTLPVDCKITSVAGSVCTWLHFTPNSSEQIVAKSGECDLIIQDTKDIGDYDEDNTILPDLQDRVSFAENNIEDLINKLGEISPSIHCGSDMPTDPNVMIWIKPNSNGEDVFGDIEAALDSIIASQENYISRSPFLVNEVIET